MRDAVRNHEPMPLTWNFDAHRGSVLVNVHGLRAQSR